MTTATTEAPAPTRPEPKGDTTLRNIRIEDDLWAAAKEPAERLDRKGGRSKVCRDALATLVAREDDMVWQDLERLAAERGLAPEALRDQIVEQYLAKVKRDRETQRRRRTSAT